MWDLRGKVINHFDTQIETLRLRASHSEPIISTLMLSLLLLIIPLATREIISGTTMHPEGHLVISSPNNTLLGVKQVHITVQNSSIEYWVFNETALNALFWLVNYLFNGVIWLFIAFIINNRIFSRAVRRLMRCMSILVIFSSLLFGLVSLLAFPSYLAQINWHNLIWLMLGFVISIAILSTAVYDRLSSLFIHLAQSASANNGTPPLFNSSNTNRRTGRTEIVMLVIFVVLVGSNYYFSRNVIKLTSPLSEILFVILTLLFSLSSQWFLLKYFIEFENSQEFLNEAEWLLALKYNSLQDYRLFNANSYPVPYVVINKTRLNGRLIRFLLRGLPLYDIQRKWTIICK